jgi:hypothetical protein
MDSNAIEIELFRACATTLLGLPLSSEEAEAGARLFRKGQLSARLAAVLDGLAASQTPAGETNKASSGVRPAPVEKRSSSRKQETLVAEASPRTLFDDVKRKKITKDQLFNLLRQVDERAFATLPLDVSMRDAIAEFRSRTDHENWNFLVSTLRGATTSDPYLVRLTEHRR